MMYMDFWIVLGLATLAGCLPGTATLAPKSSSIPIDGRLHTFTLHELQTSPDPMSGTWIHALEACQREGSQLAAVRSQQVQNVMRELQRSVNSSSGTHHARLSGRRSPDKTWRDLNGQTVTVEIRDRSYPEPALCGLAAYQGDSVTINKNRCTTTGSRKYRPLCETPTSSNGMSIHGSPHQDIADYLFQTPRSSNGSCPMGFRLVGPVGCYALLGESTTSWLTARQQCQELAPIDDLGDRDDLGDLAYSGLDETDIREFVLLHGRDPGSSDTSPVSVWVGVMSQPWMWWTTANPPSAANRSSLVTYQAWVHTEGASGKSEACMALDLGHNASWTDVACDTAARYYVCQRDEGTTVSDMTSRPTEGPLFTDHGNTVSMMSGVPAEEQLLTESQVIAIAVAGGVLFLLLVLTPLAVYCHRKRKRLRNGDQSHEYVNHIEAADAGNDVEPYATSGQFSHPGIRGVTSPDKVARPVKAPKKKKKPVSMETKHGAIDANHVMGPTGDLYTLPNKSAGRTRALAT